MIKQPLVNRLNSQWGIINERGSEISETTSKDSFDQEVSMRAPEKALISSHMKQPQ